jgi:hypothetical protein
MKKKGQGLSLNTIIVAAIVLIVLVVLWAIFTGRMGVFSKGLTDVTKGQSCTEAGGQERTEITGCSDSCTRIYGNFKDLGAGEICCRPTQECMGPPESCEEYTSKASCEGAKGDNDALLGCTWEVDNTKSC